MQLPERGAARHDTTRIAFYNQRIPVRNIWLLMLYASDVYADLLTEQTGIENNPDMIPDLLAELLCARVEARMRQQWTRGYQERRAHRTRVRGRIDMLETQRHQLLRRGQIACRFEEFTPNTPRNCHIRDALETLGNLATTREWSTRCRSLARTLWQSGVVGQRPPRNHGDIRQFGRHDAHDRPVVALADLAYDLSIPDQSAGRHMLHASPHDDVTWVRKLFERAVGGFYRVVLAAQGWQVCTGRVMQWPVSLQSERAHLYFPGMQTDIELRNAENTHLRIIDTKFNPLLVKNQHGDLRFRSGYIYQMYAYLSGRKFSVPQSCTLSGMLLHPSMDGEEVHEWVQIQQYTLHFCTVNLAGDGASIRRRLLVLVQDW